MNQPEQVPARVTLNRDQLAALLAHHADTLAANLRTDGTTGLPEHVAGVQRAAELLDLHAEHLTAEKECPAVAELLDSMLTFRSGWPAPAVPAGDRAALRDRIRLAIARQFYDEVGSERSLDELEPEEFAAYADAVLAVLPAPTDRAAVDRVRAVLETEAVVGRSALEYRGLIASALMVGEAQPPQPQPTPCSVPNPCEDGELCAAHEEEKAHADGEHEYCGVTCEVAMPTELMRNSLIAWAPPGGKGILAELERRAAAGQPSKEA